jgi:hypothetical protein
VTLDGDPIDVIVGIEAERISLTSNGSEIGSWSPEECQIVENEAGNYLILAEDERLPFSPRSQEKFAAALAGERSIPDEKGHPNATGPRHLEEAPARPVTMVGFYALAVVTALLGLWAVWSIVV